MILEILTVSFILFVGYCIAKPSTFTACATKVNDKIDKALQPPKDKPDKQK